MTTTEAITKLTNIMHDDHYAWHPSVLTAFGMAVDALRGLPSAQPTHNNTSNALKSLDCIDRQAAIDEIGRFIGYIDEDMIERIRIGLKRLPSAQPELAIPLQWIEGQIEWLKSLDNAFSTLTAGQISAMVNKWESEQDG